MFFPFRILLALSLHFGASGQHSSQFFVAFGGGVVVVVIG